MDRLIELINLEFNNEFKHLKVLEIVYNKRAYACTISFLYPQKVQEITLEQKQKLQSFLKNKLDLNAKLYLKFKKSFLDEEIILNEVYAFFKKNFSSLASLMKKEDIKITVNGEFVDILLKISEQYLQFFDKNTILSVLDKHMQKHFWADFTYHFCEGRVLNEEEIEEKVEAEKVKKIHDIQFLPRYKVYDVSKVFGSEITPEPEFLSNIKEPKNSVILAGWIENLNEYTYKKVRNGEEVEKTYFKFILKEATGARLNCIYFCAKNNYDKMKKLVNGDSILIICDIQKDFKSLTGKIKSVSLCEIPEKIEEKDFKTPKEYKVVFPEKIVETSQKNLFVKDAEYDDNISKNTFVVFDVETTGLDADTCELIEIGAVKVVNGIVSEKFQTLIKPKKKISDLITDITHITNEMVENAPISEQAIKDFYLFAKGTVLSGYNVGFDMKFIQNAGRDVGLKFENEVQDVMVLARQKVRSSNFKLGTVVKALGIELVDAHRAFNDAYATAKVLLKLSEIS